VSDLSSPLVSSVNFSSLVFDAPLSIVKAPSPDELQAKLGLSMSRPKVNTFI
jgi:hypothetical protein